MIAQQPITSSPPALPSDTTEPATPHGAEPETAITGPVAGRYDLSERIAKGGMGIVYRAQDRLLNRTVALKIIRTRFLERPDLLRRFMAEARISGRLQHPGIVPVYEVGTLADNRPFIAMKLIEGRTLSRALRDRAHPADNLAHFLKVFETLCHTIAYAHQQGVIHRDLKPDNVMVGEFGEVQVMDWGLAKYLDPSAAVAPAPDGFEAVERSAYLSGDGTTPAGGEMQTMATAVVPVGPDAVTAGYTTAGEVFGTLPYMPPEQARGETDKVDRRGDVFALGAILCQILTGQPPYYGEPETVKDQARGGKLFGAYILLDRCGVEPCLVLLAKHCLAAEPDDRPADAGVLAALVTQCLESLQDQNRAIEVKRLTAEARLAEAEAKEILARRARRLSRMLAVAGVGVAGLLAAGLGWYSNDRSARAGDDARRRSVAMHQIGEALTEAEALLEQVRTGAGSSVVRDAAARQALSACQRAGSLIDTTPNTADDVRERFVALKRRATETECGTRLTVALEEWRTGLFDGRGRLRPEADRQLQELLEHHGVRVLDRPVEEIKAHPAAPSLRAAITDWVAIAESRNERWHLATLVWHCWESLPRDWMNALLNRDLDAMLALVTADPKWEIPAAWLTVIAHWLSEEEQADNSERLLAFGVRRFPADFTLNAMYGSLLRQKPDAQAEAVRYLTVARTARPNDLVVQKELGLALAHAGRTDEAVEVLKAALQSEPKWVAGHTRLGELLEKRGDPDAARASYLTAIGVDAKHTPAHLGLARAEIARGDLGAAELAFRSATADASHKGPAHAGLGQIHLKRWEASKAVAEFRAAVAADPRNADYRLGLVEAFRISNDLPAATREARTAARAAPRSATVHKKLGDLSRLTGDRMGAVAAYRSAIKVEPADADTHLRLAEEYEAVNDPALAADAYQAAADLRPKEVKLLLAVARTRQKAGQHGAAREAYRQAVDADPSEISVRRQFAQFLTTRGDEAAIAELTAAAKARPEDVELRIELGETLLTFGRCRESAAAFREAADKLPEGPRQEDIRSQARTATRLAGLCERLPDVLSGAFSPSSPAGWAGFGETAGRTKRYAAAARCYARAAEGDKRYAGPAAVYAALAGFGIGNDSGSLTPEARAELRQAAFDSFRQSRGLLADPSLVVLRDASDMERLSAEERSAWRSLWAGE